jgi:hypothetical protein
MIFYQTRDKEREEYKLILIYLTAPTTSNIQNLKRTQRGLPPTIIQCKSASIQIKQKDNIFLENAGPFIFSSFAKGWPVLSKRIIWSKSSFAQNLDPNLYLRFFSLHKLEKTTFNVAQHLSCIPTHQPTTDEWEKIILATTIILFSILHVDSLFKLKDLKIITIDVISSLSFSFDITLQALCKARISCTHRQTRTKCSQ